MTKAEAAEVAEGKGVVHGVHAGIQVVGEKASGRACSRHVEEWFEGVVRAEKFGKCGPRVSVKCVCEIIGALTSHVVGIIVVSMST